MQLLILTFVIILLAMAGMAIGVMAGRGALRGSCGGLNLPDGTRIGCGACTRPQRCPRRANKHAAQSDGE